MVSRPPGHDHAKRSLQLKLVFVIECIRDQPQLFRIVMQLAS